MIIDVNITAKTVKLEENLIILMTLGQTMASCVLLYMTP